MNTISQKRLKPFNRKEVEAGAQVVTRSGLPVTQLTFFENVQETDYTLLGVCDGGLFFFLPEDGSCDCKESKSPYDLFILNPPKVGYLSIIERSCSNSTLPFYFSAIYDNISELEELFPRTYAFIRICYYDDPLEIISFDLVPR